MPIRFDILSAALALLPLALACDDGAAAAGTQALPWPDTRPSAAAQAATERSAERAARLGAAGESQPLSDGALLDKSGGEEPFDPFAGDPPEAQLPPPEEEAGDGAAGSGSVPEEVVVEEEPPGCRFNGHACVFSDGIQAIVELENDHGHVDGTTLVFWDPATSAPSFTVHAEPWQKFELNAGFLVGDDWGVQVEGRDVVTLDRVAVLVDGLWRLKATDLKADQSCKFNGNVCSVFDGFIGTVRIHNDAGFPANVVFYHPDTGGSFLEELVEIGAIGTPDPALGDDWGVQLNGQPVRTLDRVARHDGSSWELWVSDLDNGYLVEAQ